MAAPVILIEALPRSPVDGAPVTVRLAGGGDVHPYTYLGQHWRAGINGLPSTVAALDHDGEQLGGGGVAQAMALRWAAPDSAALADLAAHYWGDAAVTVRIGPEGADPPVVTTGLVMESGAADGELKLALGDLAPGLKRPVLGDRFAGTGDLEGPIEWKGQLKTRALGRCFNVPGRCIDPAYNIWSFGDPGRPWQAFDQVRDRGAAAAALPALAWQDSIAATLAALRAAVTPEGGGVACPSLACVRWWKEPVGDLHADIRGETAGGYVATAPEIAARIVAGSGVAFAPGAVAAAKAARPDAFGRRIATESATIAGELSALLAEVSLSWLIVDDAIVFRRWDWSAPVRTARSEGVVRRQVFKPVASRRLGYRLNQAPMSRGDIAAAVLAGLNAPLILTQWSADGVGGWHEVYAEGEDFYSRQSNDDGVTWGPAVRSVGQDGISPPSISLTADKEYAKYDAGNNYVGGDIRFTAVRQNILAATTFRVVRVDTGVVLVEGTAAYLASTNSAFQGSSDDVLVYRANHVNFAINTYGDLQVIALVGGYPVTASVSIAKIKDGSNGLNAPLLLTQWSVDGVSGWHTDPVEADFYQRHSNDGGITWGPAKKVVGDSVVGADGITPATIFLRSATVPATPASNTGNPPPGWSDGPPAGAGFIWQSNAKFRDGAQLVAWSPPQRISGEKGADALGVAATPEGHSVSCDFGGAPKAGEGTKASGIKITAGTADVTSIATVTVSGKENCNASYSAGVLTMTSFSGDSGFAELTIALNGASTEKRVPFGKARDGAPGNANATALTSSGGAAYTDASAIIAIAVQGSGTLAASAGWRSGVNSSTRSGGVRILYRATGATTWQVLAASEAEGEPSGPFVVSAVANLSTSAAAAYELMAQTMRSGTHGAITLGRLSVSWQP